MTAAYIAFHAAERPDAVALINNGREITYAEFSRDIRKFTRALREFGLPRGAKVAVVCDDIYFHWLLLLAFERFGIASASFDSGDGRGWAPLLARMDLVLAGPHFPSQGARRHHPVTQQWLQGVLAQPDENEQIPLSNNPDDPVRILLTSGTTGTSKMMLVSRAAHEVRVSRYASQYQFTRDSRYFVTTGFAVGLIHGCATACVRFGGTVISQEIADIAALAQAVAARAVTHINFLPLHLRQVLDELPKDFAKPDNLTVGSFGAAVSESLRARVIARLATTYCNDYGCNEAGMICSVRSNSEDQFGTVWPGVRVEVVDERDEPLPRGQVGRIRIKTEYMVQGYQDDPDATADKFRDGWFYPGDMGVLDGPRRLHLVGRGDELLNIGGQKCSPSSIEDRVLGHTMAADVGVCSIPNADGIEEIWIAVSNARDSDEELLEQISRAFRPFQFGGFYVVRMDRIPRNANGKIQRGVLKDVAARMIRPR